MVEGIFLSCHAEHDLRSKDSVFIGEFGGSSVFLCNMLHRLESDSVSLALGGLKNFILLLDLSMKGIFHLDQKKVRIRKIDFHIDLPLKRFCF